MRKQEEADDTEFVMMKIFVTEWEGKTKTLERQIDRAIKLKINTLKSIIWDSEVTATCKKEIEATTVCWVLEH